MEISDCLEIHILWTFQIRNDRRSRTLPYSPYIWSIATSFFISVSHTERKKTTIHLLSSIPLSWRSLNSFIRMSFLTWQLFFASTITNLYRNGWFFYYTTLRFNRTNNSNYLNIIKPSKSNSNATKLLEVSVPFQFNEVMIWKKIYTKTNHIYS